MVEINFKGNEQLEEQLLDCTTQEIKLALKNKEALFACYGMKTLVGGDALDVLTIVGLGLNSLFEKVKKQAGAPVAEALRAGFINALSED